MYSFSNLQAKTFSKASSNDSLLINKIKKIRNTLLNLEKEEVNSFSPLNLEIYKDIKNHKPKKEIKIPITFKSYFEDFQNNKEIINKIISGDKTSSNDNSIQAEQIDSSDLVNSE